MSHGASSVDVGAPCYSGMFLDEFDVSSPRRHLQPDRLTFENMEDEVTERYRALQIVRKRDIWHPRLTEALATLYVMVLEDDGRNWEQLHWAGVSTFLLAFMRERLLEGVSENHGWPLENALNTLAIALFWLMSRQDRLDQETDELRQEIMTHLAPFAFAGFRDLFLACDASFKASTVHCTTNRCITVTLNYFGQPTTLCLPPIAPFATLSYFARMEYFHLGIPPELPLDRRDALAKGVLCGPTRDDIQDFNAGCATRTADKRYGDLFDGLTRSRRHDPDRRRLLSGSDLVRSHARLVYYVPGTFSGRWQGSFIAPYQDAYRSMRCSADAPSPFPSSSRFPLYVTFRELYCYAPSTPLPVGEDEVSFFNGFLPLGCRWCEDESGVEFVGPHGSFKTRYVLSRDVSTMQVLDVIVTGVTEAPYATAWNGYKYIGRVRPSDGLVVLLREPLDPLRVDLGRALFRGYVVSSRNFVGRWRHIAGAAQPAEWESIFSLCKEVKLA